MSITIAEVKSKSDLRKFIYLPEKIHKDHKNWLPPIYSDEWTLFSSNKNRAFLYCDTIMLLAFKGKELVGRIMGIINNKYNEIHSEKTARFSFVETYNDQEVFHLLLMSIEEWALSKGMTRIVGPFGFSDKDPQGFLIEGFDEPTVMVTNCSFSYMIDLIENEGYTTHLDLVQYRLKTPEKLPDFYERVFKRIESNGYMLHEFTSRKELKKYIIPVFELTNNTYTKIFGYVPFDQKEMKEYARRYLSILDPRFIKVITHNGELIAYIIGMPNISEGIRNSKGRLFPFGFIKIFRSMKKTSQLDLLLGAIKEEYQNRGLDTLLATSMLNSAHKANLKTIDSHVIMESNTKMRAEYERFGGEVYKRYRVFKKDLVIN